MGVAATIGRIRRLQRLQQTLAIERLEREQPSTPSDEKPQAELPFAKYHDDPVAFAKEVLGIQFIWKRQEEILRKAAQRKKLAVRSGHKIGKSKSAVIIAAWWMCTRPRAKVIFLSSSWEGVKETLWPELRKLHRESVQPLGGYLLDTPHGGWRFDDGRSCFGVSPSTPERAAGKSGDELLYICDEASGIEDDIFEAIEGNLAGGANVIMFGNPTQQSGQFFRAFHEESDVWEPIQVSSEESPNVVARAIVIPGLATFDWVEERRRKWGKDDPRYLVRVKGDFASKGSNNVIGLAIVTAAKKRWSETKAEGALELGIDVARFGDDDTVIYPRRGKKALEPTEMSGQDTVAIVGKAIEIIQNLRLSPEERVKVKVDVIGIGAGVADLLRAQEERLNIEVIDINVSEASDDEEEFPNLRSQLWFGMGMWLDEGGAVPPQDNELGPELMTPRYGFDERGRRRVEKKDDIKARLGRSPDHAEALMLSIAKGNAHDWSATIVRRGPAL